MHIVSSHPVLRTAPLDPRVGDATARPAGPSAVEVAPLTPAIGAVVSGVDLSHPLDPETVSVLADLVDRHQVVFPRDQHVTSDEFAFAARQFGPFGTHPVDDLLGRRRTTSVIEDTADRPPAGFDWHTDLSWTAQPPRLGFLRAVVIPSCGGDTLWASGREMYRRLDAETRAEVERWSLVHAPDPSFVASIRRHHGDDLADRLVRLHGERAHPLVRAHPATGEPALWLSPLSTTRIAGRSPDGHDSRHVLGRLDALIDDPEVQVRWRWAAGDVAIWDETSTVHRALTDHAPQRRVMERCTTSGDAPRAFRSTRGAAAS